MGLDHASLTSLAALGDATRRRMRSPIAVTAVAVRQSRLGAGSGSGSGSGSGCGAGVPRAESRQLAASAAATALGLLLGFAPQLVLSIACGQPRTCSPKPVRPAGSSPSFRCSEGIS